jgi:arabinogalactan oligomer/maltooligosaccharide transport system permease protein
MTPGVVQWIAVIPVDSEGAPLLDTQALAPVAGRTDLGDERTPPPDSRPVAYALGAIVLSAIVLLSFLRWQDARRGRNRSRLAHWYVAPGIIALAALTFYPILYGIWLAFTDADQSHLGDTAFIGLQNFVHVFQTPGVWRVTAFTFIWSIANVTFHVLLGLVLAIALNRPGLKGKTIYRTILLLPWAIPAYISVLAWNGMLQPDGLVNGVLGTQIDFLADRDMARVVVILVNIWLGVPFMMAAFSGALQALGQDMFEAADVDGVSRWDQLVYLTLPNLKSTLVPVSLLGFIWSFNAFNTIYLLSRGGPYVGFGEPGATDILVTYVFEVAFTYGHYGLAAAWSVLIFLMLVGFSWVYLKRTRATEAAA